MPVSIKFRRALGSALAAGMLAAASSALAGQPPRDHQGVPPPHSMGDHGRPQPNHGQRGMRSQRQEHLEQWMNRHSNLSLPQQQQALEKEPGFRRLSPQIQQHLRDRLTQLNNMPADRRRRLIERNEAMERLTQPERQQVFGAMQQLHGLPQDRRRFVARAFRDLRRMPSSQRREVLNSESFRGQFSPQEQTTLSDLLAIEPYLPPPHSDQGSPPEK